MVAAIQCRGEDLAFFPPRLFFPATFLYICSENAVHIGGFYFSQAASVPAACYSSKEECRNRFVRLCCRMQDKRMDYCKVRIEV